jgi:hypothetical protein
MKYAFAFLVAFFALCTPAAAQWQTPNHSVPIGRGVGATGFSSAVPGAAGMPFTSNGPGTDPSFRPAIVNQVTPEMYGALANGSFDDAVPIRAAMSALHALGKGTLRLGCTTYNLASVGANGALINNYSGVDIIGCGSSSVLRVANGMNTSSASFVFGISPVSQSSGDAINNASYRSFVIDMNGANNDCGGTCYAYSYALGALYGDNILVDGVTVLNTPGSQGIAFGSNANTFPTMSNVSIVNSTFENACDSINPACTDHSAIWIKVQNGVISNNKVQSCGPAFGTGIELHGFNVVGNGNNIWNCQKGLILASDSFLSVNMNSVGIVASNNTIINVAVGIDVWDLVNTSFSGPTISGNYIQLTGVAGNIAGIDASTHVGSFGSALLSIVGNVITSSLTTTIANANSFSGILVNEWQEASIVGNTITNMGGPGIWFNGNTSPTQSIWHVFGNVLEDDGRVTSVSTLQTGILSTANNANAGAINIQGNVLRNTSTAYMTTGISGVTNSLGGLVAGNVTSNIATPVNWTGTGTGVGQVCSGTPTSSFASYSGVVTHC